MSGSRITLAEGNRDDFIQRVAEHMAYLDDCLELTLAAYIADQEPKMRERTWLGLGAPYWTEQRSPTWQEVDDYRVSLSEWNWRIGRDKTETFEGVKAAYNVILMALLNGDVVELDEVVYNKLMDRKEPSSWYRSL